MTEVKYALTLTRPWPALMVPPGPKEIENRTWPPPPWILGKRIALHAGEKFDDAGWLKAQQILAACGQSHLLPGIMERMVVKGLVGTAVVAGCMRPLGEDDPPWLFGPFGWMLEDRRPLATPVPCRGFQKLWTLPRDARAAVEAQL